MICVLTLYLIFRQGESANNVRNAYQHNIPSKFQSEFESHSNNASLVTSIPHSPSRAPTLFASRPKPNIDVPLNTSESSPRNIINNSLGHHRMAAEDADHVVASIWRLFAASFSTSKHTRRAQKYLFRRPTCCAQLGRVSLSTTTYPPLTIPTEQLVTTSRHDGPTDDGGLEALGAGFGGGSGV